jgi:nuclease-like protein
VTKRLLPPGSRVWLFTEPATDRVDQYGRLLRYVVRVRDGLNVNVQLVRVGAAAPYFYRGRRGHYAALLERLALRARAKRPGLWAHSCRSSRKARHRPGADLCGCPADLETVALCWIAPPTCGYALTGEHPASGTGCAGAASTTGVSLRRGRFTGASAAGDGSRPG